MEWYFYVIDGALVMIFGYSVWSTGRIKNLKQQLELSKSREAPEMANQIEAWRKAFNHAEEYARKVIEELNKLVRELEASNQEKSKYFDENTSKYFDIVDKLTTERDALIKALEAKDSEDVLQYDKITAASDNIMELTGSLERKINDISDSEKLLDLVIMNKLTMQLSQATKPLRDYSNAMDEAWKPKFDAMKIIKDREDTLKRAMEKPQALSDIMKRLGKAFFKNSILKKFTDSTEEK